MSSAIDILPGHGSAPAPAVVAHPDNGERTSLTAGDVQSILARNSQACVRHSLAGVAQPMVCVRYAWHLGGLFVPAWTTLDPWYDERPRPVECDVSEVDGHLWWRYVWLRGVATPLLPTGAQAERDGWRAGIAALRRRLPALAATDQLALDNFGVVRVDITSARGTVVACR